MKHGAEVVFEGSHVSAGALADGALVEGILLSINLALEKAVDAFIFVAFAGDVLLLQGRGVDFLDLLAI